MAKAYQAMPTSSIAASLSLQIDRRCATVDCMKCRRFLPYLFAALVIGPLAISEARSAPPQPTPALYVTRNYGIIVRMPPGLTYCPLPTDWVGSDHGTTVFLVPPDDCASSAGYPSSARGWSGAVPLINLYYGYNVAEMPRRGEDPSPPRSARELAKFSCEKPHVPIPTGIILLGKPGVGCAYHHGRAVTIRVMTLSVSGIIDVTLETTADRLTADLPVLQAFTRAVTVCSPDAPSPKDHRPPCPTEGGWW